MARVLYLSRPQWVPNPFADEDDEAYLDHLEARSLSGFDAVADLADKGMYG